MVSVVHRIWQNVVVFVYVSGALNNNFYHRAVHQVHVHITASIQAINRDQLSSFIRHLYMAYGALHTVYTSVPFLFYCLVRDFIDISAYKWDFFRTLAFSHILWRQCFLLSEETQSSPHPVYLQKHSPLIQPFTTYVKNSRTAGKSTGHCCIPLEILHHGI